MTAAARGRARLALGLMVASGFAGLGYQVVWTQQNALWLGHESAAVLAVVAAFFGGLAVGALTLGARIERSAHPARWYAACEIATGLWGAALALLMAPMGGWLLDITGAQPSAAWQWSVAFVGTFVMLLPATAAMGATLPAIERTMAPLRERGASIAALYAGNTFGAVVGVLACAFWLVPEFGLATTAGVCVVLNLLCGCAALAWQAEPAQRPPQALVPAPHRMLWRLAATGLLGIGYEVLVVRVLSQVAENTVYTFAMLLAVYLVGSALGAAAYSRWWVARADPERLRDGLLWALASACLLGGASLWGSDALTATVQQALGPGLATALAGEATLAVTAFLLPTMLMGALFSHLGTHARTAGIGLGRSLGVNTLGAAAAPWLFGVVLIPALGPKLALLAVVAGYLLLMSPRSWLAPAACTTIGATLAIGVWAPMLAFIDVPEGGHIVSYRDGTMAAVSVVEDAAGVSRLRIDNRQQEGSSSSLLADARQALIPLMLHPAPRHALFLGLGTGVTASSAAEDAQLQVDAVELLPEVIEASAHFRRAFAGGEPHPRLHLMAADARRFVRATDQRYDLIVSDNFHPARSGSGALYTVEHFRAVHARLAAGGVFCQWLPLHQIDLPTLRSIVRSFMTAYPGGWAVLATHSLDTPVLGLVARENGGRFDLSQLRARLASAKLPRPLADFGINDDLALLGSFVAGPRSLRRFAGTAPLNTDDHPVVAYMAPRITYVPDSLPRDRLMAVLGEVGIEPDELIDSGQDAAWAARLAAYVEARNRYLDAGRSVLPSSDPRQMLAQVQKPLLSVLRLSPDFRPAYDPLLRMANTLGRTDAAAAAALLSDLVRAQPARPEAAAALRELVVPQP